MESKSFTNTFCWILIVEIGNVHIFPVCVVHPKLQLFKVLSKFGRPTLYVVRLRFNAGNIFVPSFKMAWLRRSLRDRYNGDILHAGIKIMLASAAP